MTSYDRMAFEMLGKKEHALKHPRIDAFIANAFAINMNIFIGASVRLRFYRRVGLTVHEITFMTLFVVTTFVLGFLGMSALFLPYAVIGIPDISWLPHMSIGLVAFVSAISVGTYIGISAVHHRSIKIWKWVLPPVHLKLALLQLAYGMVDWFIVSVAAYLLLPSLSIPFATFISVFLLAQFLGQISQAPAGLGVFEASMVVLLAPFATQSFLVGSLLLFRVMYYLVPFAVAAFLYAFYESGRIFKRARQEEHTHSSMRNP